MNTMNPRHSIKEDRNPKKHYPREDEDMGYPNLPNGGGDKRVCKAIDKANPVGSLIKSIDELDIESLNIAIVDLESALIGVLCQDPMDNDMMGNGAEKAMKSNGSSPTVGALENIRTKIQVAAERIRDINKRLEC